MTSKYILYKTFIQPPLHYDIKIDINTITLPYKMYDNAICVTRFFKKSVKYTLLKAI